MCIDDSARHKEIIEACTNLVNEVGCASFMIPVPDSTKRIFFGSFEDVKNMLETETLS